MALEPMYIVAADAVVDGIGDLSPSRAAIERLQSAGRRIVNFEISASGDGWDTPLPDTTLRCACAPMLAINKAGDLFAAGQSDAVVIHGRDNLRTDYKNRKDERNRLLEIYGAGKGRILEGYQKLAEEFLDYWRLSLDEFRRAAQAIFDNHLRVWQQSHPDGAPPGEQWFDFISELFRGVDCANPSVDFEGAMVVAGEKAMQDCDFGGTRYARIAGCAVEQACEDGLETTPEIVPYKHLAAAYAGACRAAGVDFAQAYKAGDALLEIYTCYPVVPMGFLLATGFVERFAEIIPLVEKFPLTVTGGLNLAKAPWNNTTLQALAEVTATLQRKDTPDLAGVHSLGALGYLQAFAVLELVDS